MSKCETEPPTSTGRAFRADGVTPPVRGRRSQLPPGIVWPLVTGKTIAVTAARKMQVDQKPEQPRALAAWRILAPGAQQMLRDIAEHDSRLEAWALAQERADTPGPPAGWRWIVLDALGFHPTTPALVDLLRGLEWHGLLELRDVSSSASDSSGDTSAGGPQHGSGRPATRPAALRLTRNGRKLVHLIIGLPDRRSGRPPDVLPGTLWRILLAVAEVALDGLPADDVPPGLGRQLTTAGRWPYLELRPSPPPPPSRWKAAFRSSVPEAEAPLRYFLTAAGRDHIVTRASDYALRFPDLWMSDAAFDGRTHIPPDLAELLRRLRAGQQTQAVRP
jgi:hypothetical protein